MELYQLIAVVDRETEPRLETIFQNAGTAVGLSQPASGTAGSEVLARFGLADTEKRIVMTVASRSQQRMIFQMARKLLYLDIPGNGILAAIPVKTVAGQQTLSYLTDSKITGGVPSMDFEYELIVVVLNAGYADTVMDAAREAGAGGGRIIAEGAPDELNADPASMIGPFLGDSRPDSLPDMPEEELFALGEISMQTGPIHTVKPLSVRFPKGRLSVVTGVSGSGKTTMILESLVPALGSLSGAGRMPEHVTGLSAEGIRQIKLIDATPIGVNVRSTVATYAGVHDELRKVYARTGGAKERGYRAGDFSYNTGSLRCPVCDGTGTVSLDVQFLPDVDVPCPSCRGSRYAPEAYRVLRTGRGGRTFSLPGLMELSVDEALSVCSDLSLVRNRLQILCDLGLGYLTLGEETPGLSGGEAQRLKLAGEMGRGQEDAVFVFDEPTIGLHPLDVRTLLSVFRRLIATGATVIVIEHDLDVIRSADYIVDMGPGGGEAGGRVVASGTPASVRADPESVTGRYI